MSNGLTRVRAVGGVFAVLTTIAGAVGEWKLSLALLPVAVLSVALIVGVRRSRRCWLFWLRLRFGSSQGFKAMARRVAIAVDPPSADERYAWDSQTDEGVPLVVPARLADKHKVWPHWAFNIRIVRNGLEVSAERAGPVVTVRLGESDFAIYNNEGKRWLQRSPRAGEEYPSPKATLSEEFSAAMEEAQTRRDGWSTTVGEGFPLRWASAGCLPIAKIAGAEWVVLFFRDLRPMGWNVANGASESVEEQVDVARVLRREFREELTVLSDNPLRAPGKRPKSVHVRSLLWAGESREQRFDSPGLKLRREHDGFTIIDDKDVRSRDAVAVAPKDTPWRIRVIAADGSTSWLDNIIPSLDAGEHGVEAIQVVSLRLDEDDVLLDGEDLEKTPALVRRPVVLLRLDELRDLYRRTGGLGTQQEGDKTSKVLPALPDAAIRVGGVEAKLARARRTALEAVETDNARKERQHLDLCLRRHEALLQGRLDAPHLQLDRLGPVAWSTLEAYFALEDRSSGVRR